MFLLCIVRETVPWTLPAFVNAILKHFSASAKWSFGVFVVVVAVVVVAF
jgi:hypothetical protein